MEEQTPVPTGAQLTLRVSPTGGAPGEHSPYYRRLLSAGYKGYLQGVIGGGTLYGLMGAGIGAAIATTLFFTGAVATPVVWALIPAVMGLGLFKGASTFGNIGSVAAITAESSDMLEERRYLLERYYDLPLSHDYDDEARAIEHLLVQQHEVKPPKHVFHWKTALVCAVLGVAIGVGLAYAAPFVLEALHLGGMLELIGLEGLAHGTAFAASSEIMAICGAIGGLAGTMIGLDRFYVRRWLDFSEGLLVDPEQISEHMKQKQKDVDTLISASPTRGAETSSRRHGGRAERPIRGTPDPYPPTVHVEHPTTSVSSVQMDARLADIHTALARPTV